MSRRRRSIPRRQPPSWRPEIALNSITSTPPKPTKDELSKCVKVERTFDFHKKQIITLAYFPKHRRLVSSGWDYNLIFSDIFAERPSDVVIKTIDLKVDTKIPDNLVLRKFNDDLVLSISSATSIASFNVDTCEKVSELDFPNMIIRTFAILNNDLIVVSPRDPDSKMTIASYKQLKILRTIELPIKPSSCFGFCISKRHESGIYITWLDYSTTGHGMTLFKFHKDTVEKEKDFKVYEAWSSDPVTYYDQKLGREMVVFGGDYEGKFQSFDSVDCKKVHEFDVPEQVQSMKVVDDQFIIIGFNTKGMIRVYDIKDGFKLVAEKKVFSKGVRDLQIIESRKGSGEVKIVCSGNSSEVAIVSVKGLKFCRKSELEMEDEKERIEFLEKFNHNIFFERRKEFCTTLKTLSFEMEILKLFLRL